jgi:hypothetical protein
VSLPPHIQKTLVGICVAAFLALPVFVDTIFPADLGELVLSRSTYVGTAGLITVGQTPSGDRGLLAGTGPCKLNIRPLQSYSFGAMEDPV